MKENGRKPEVDSKYSWKVEVDKYFVEITRIDNRGEKYTERKEYLKTEDFPPAKEVESVVMYHFQEYTKEVSVSLPSGAKATKLIVGVRNGELINYIAYEIEETSPGVKSVEHIFAGGKPKGRVGYQDKDAFITKDIRPYFDSLLKQVPTACKNLEKGIEQLEVLPPVQNPNTVV